MNAAARFNQGVLSRGWAISVFLTRVQFSTLIVGLTILSSALMMVYITNCTRCLNASLQQSLVDRDHLYVQHGQLLLEKSTWMMQARVQQIAEDKLGMVVPTGKSVIIVN